MLLCTLLVNYSPSNKLALELQEVMDEMESTISMKFTTEDITNFQSQVAKTFFTLLKENIQNWFNSNDVVSSYSVFDPKKMPKTSKTLYYVLSMVTKASKPSFNTTVESFQQNQCLMMNL